MKSFEKFLIFAILGFTQLGFSQTAGDFRSFQTGNWNDVNSWERYDGALWINPAPSTPTNADGLITVLNTHTITVTANVTIDQTTVDAGGQITINSTFTLTINDGAGTDITVDGTIFQTGTFNFTTFATSTGIFNNGSFLIGNTGTNTIPVPASTDVTYANGSTIKIIGFTTAANPQRFPATCYNAVWDCPAQITSNVLCIGSTPTNINGNLTIVNTNSSFIKFVSGAARTVNIAGNLQVDGGILYFGASGGAGNVIVNVSGDIIMNGGELHFYAGASTTSPASNVTVSGNITLNGGLINMNESTKPVSCSLNGNLNLSGGTVTFSSNTGIPTINLNGNMVLNSGTLNVATSTGVPIFTVSGNWTNNGGIYNPGTGTNKTIFNNTTASQYINGSATSQTFNNITVNKSGQTLSVDGSTTTLTINGTLILSAGIFDKGTASTINIYGDWTNNGGTFTSGTGTVYFINTSAAQNINGSATIQTFNNITVGKSGQTLTVSGSTTELVINSNLNLSTGSFDIGTALTLNIPGNWANNGGNFIPGSGTIIFNGSSGTQTIGGSNPTTFYNLTIDNSSGGVTQLLPVTISNILTLTNGAFDLNELTTIVSNAATNAIVRTNGYIISETNASSNTSKLQWNIGSTPGNHIFPFGTTDGAYYIPVTFNNNGNTSGNVTIATRPTAASDNQPWAAGVTSMSGIGTNVTSALDRWWDISCSTNPMSGSGADIIFSYAGTENSSTTNPTDTRGIQHWTGSYWNDGKGGTEASVTTSSDAGVTGAVVGTVTVSGLTEFSPFIIVRASNPLPIELLDFNVELIENKIDIAWITASEINNNYFTVERSINSLDFEKVTIVQGANNSNTLKHYYTTDEHPYNGLSYYRLKQTDFDGKFEYSQLVAVDVKLINEPDFIIYPNPANQKSQLFCTFDYESSASVTITDISGKIINIISTKVSTGLNSILINADKLAPGMYFSILQTPFDTIKKKFIKN